MEAEVYLTCEKCKKNVLHKEIEGGKDEKGEYNILICSACENEAKQYSQDCN